MQTCICGEPISTVTVDATRGITDTRRNETSVPVERVCRDGHTTIQWLLDSEAQLLVYELAAAQ